jgi:hypothetical protein
MTSSRRAILSRPRLLVAACVLAAGVGLALPWLAAPPTLAPIAVQAEVLASDVYRVADRVRRIPVEIALPRIAQAALPPFVASLPLGDGARARILARLDARDFVDQLVPFLLAVKAMYRPPEEQRALGFDTYLRRHFRPEDAIPGMEHSMFDWQRAQEQPADVQAPAEARSVGMDRQLIAELLGLYDAIFLAGREAESPPSERLECDAASDPRRLAETADRAGPALEALLQKLRARMEAGSEMEQALAEVLNDAARLETISLSVVQFIDLMVCKHYRFFATRLQREQQLRDFLLGELARPDGGRLWRYLDWAVNGRRYGVLVVVDGLQGHLVEALARGEARSPFLQAIADEQRRGASGVAPDVPGKPAPDQRTAFLEHVAGAGFQHPHYLRFFRDLYDVDPDGTPGVEPWAISRSGVSTTPTISVRNLPVVLTGAPVAGEGSTGIPNFHFVDRTHMRDGDRQGRAYYFYGNDALQLSALASEAGMRTLYERLPEHSSYSCAAQYDERAQAGVDPFFNLALGEALRDFAEVLCFGELARRAESTRRLRSLHADLLALRETLGVPLRWWDWYRGLGRRAELRRAEQLVEAIARLETDGMPELLLWYDPWPDHFAHFTGPFSDEIIAPSGELARLDYWLQELMSVYERAGVHERTLFAMAGDHGLAPVFRLVSPEALVLDALAAKGVPLRVIKISSDEGEGPKLTNVLRPPSMRGYDVVVASTAGGNLMLDLFANQGDRWHEQPVEADLRRWRPIAWQESGEADHLDLVQELLDRLGPSLDYLAVRIERCDPGRAALRILGPGGRATIRRRGDRIHYAREPIASGTVAHDVLETDRVSPYAAFKRKELGRHRELHARCVERASASDDSSWCTEAEWRALTRYTTRPDSVVQLAHLYDLDIAGTINLFPAPGVAFNSIVPGRHAGESFHEKDAFAGVWGVPVQRSERDGRIESTLGGSIPLAIYEHLTGRAAPPEEVGWGSPSLWEAIHPPASITRASPGSRAIGTMYRPSSAEPE